MDIVDIAKDEHLFSHLIDETLSFEQELRDTLGYPNSLPSAMTVLTQAQYLTKWITIEERCMLFENSRGSNYVIAFISSFSVMTDKMDEILQKGSPWESIDPNNLEELRIPKCADQFVRLLDAIRERYCGLPQPGHQLQFLNLQLELIESFRRRLVQLHNSSTDNVKTTHILNAINYLVLVLREWGENIVCSLIQCHLILFCWVISNSDLCLSIICIYTLPYLVSMPKIFTLYLISWLTISRTGNNDYWRNCHRNRSIISKRNQWNIATTIGLQCPIRTSWNRSYCLLRPVKCYR